MHHHKGKTESTQRNTECTQTKHRMHANESTQTKARKRKFWKSSTNSSVTANAKSHKRARKLSLNDVNLAVASTVCRTEEHPTSCSLKMCSSPFFIWLENLRNTSIKKSKYDLETLKHYFIQLKYYVYTPAK